MGLVHETIVYPKILPFVPIDIIGAYKFGSIVLIFAHLACVTAGGPREHLSPSNIAVNFG